MSRKILQISFSHKNHESKQSNTNQKKQETQEKITTTSSQQLVTSIIQEPQNMMKEYMEKMGAIFNSNTCHQDNVIVKPLKIETWNANGLVKHSQEIKIFIFSQNIDTLLVSETHFTNKSYCHIRGYTIQCILMVKLIEELLLLEATLNTMKSVSSNS